MTVAKATAKQRRHLKKRQRRDQARRQKRTRAAQRVHMARERRQADLEALSKTVFHCVPNRATWRDVTKRGNYRNEWMALLVDVPMADTVLVADLDARGPAAMRLLALFCSGVLRQLPPPEDFEGKLDEVEFSTLKTTELKKRILRIEASYPEVTEGDALSLSLLRQKEPLRKKAARAALGAFSVEWLERWIEVTG